jgi:Nif-specific regulatory protein
VGKELVAHSRHTSAQSTRAERPLITVNCAALPQSVLGERALRPRAGRVHRRYVKQRAGRFELAHTRHASFSTRSAIYRRPRRSCCCACCRSGSSSASAAARRSTSTCGSITGDQPRPRWRWCAKTAFASDLYYRLNGGGDPGAPAARTSWPTFHGFWPTIFVERYGQGAITSRSERIATSAIDLLCAYHWPGNVRELENCIERAVLLLGRRRDPRPRPAAERCRCPSSSGTPGSRWRLAPRPSSASSAT